jgi:hypothetical protein
MINKMQPRLKSTVEIASSSCVVLAKTVFIVILEAIRDGRRIRGVGRNSIKVSAATGETFY